MTGFDQALDQALRSPEPLIQLRTLASNLLARGHEPAAVLELLEHERQRLREMQREADEDLVLEVMDFLAGWCSPHMRLSDNESV
jgi:hypothetical protein